MDRYATVNGLKLHYLVAGKGAPVLLLHGYAQNSHMWRPLMKELAKTHLVVAPDLRGFGDSAKPESGYDKKTMAQDVHALAQSLGIQKAGVAGHDIGLMVAYAYAAQYPSEVDRLALMDAFIPGVGDTTNLFLLKDLWHFHFYGPTPLALVKGRERIYFEHFWNDFAADGTEVRLRGRSALLCAEVCAAGRDEGGDGGAFATSTRTPRTMPSSPRPSSPCRCWCWAGRNRAASFSSPKANSWLPTSKASSSSGRAIGSSTRHPGRSFQSWWSSSGARRPQGK
mgnify:CR=1 FL=1